MNKTCCICKEDKPESEYNWRNKDKGLKQAYCSKCGKQIKKEHYRSNKQYYLTRANARNKRVRKENAERILAYLSEHPCVDCGETDVEVLTFDHVRGKKSGHVALLARTSCWERVAREIEKCDVRCANCHMRMTGRRGSWFRSMKICPSIGAVS